MDMPFIIQFAAALFTGIVIAAAVVDVATLKIPNVLVLALAGLFAAAVPFMPVPVPLLAHAAAFAAVLSGGIALYAAGWMGAGDVKLAAVVALWVGLSGLGQFLLVMVTGGAVVAMLVIVARRLLLRMAAARAARTGGSVPAILAERAKVPYGPAIALAALLMLHRTPLFGAPGVPL